MIADWLEDSPENLERYTAMRREFEAAIIHTPEATPVREPRRRRLLMRGIAAAAAVAAVVILSVAGSRYLADRKFDELAGMQMSFTVPAGQRININLHDGTNVWLNSGSRIEYPVAFSNADRRVSIEGEAVFDVSHDTSRPFIVETYACDVEVLGTHFDVTADSKEDVFSVALFNGSVKVTNRLDAAEQYILSTNERVKLVGGDLVASELEDRDEYLWTEGLISVKGLSFETLMRKFERDFGVRIIIERDLMPVTDFNYGKVRISDGVDFALRMLQLRADFTYSRNEQDGTIIIR